MTKTRVLTLIFLITLVCFSACRKKPQKIGNDLQPNNSFVTVAFNDGADIKASTFTVPYLSTKNLNYAFIGNMNDPVFGNSNFDFFTQYSLSTSSLNWGSNAVADSIVLNLTYNGYYGDTTDKQLTVKIFEILEDMYSDDTVTYKSNQVIECDDIEYANYTFVPRPLTKVDTILDRGVLRVPVDIALAEKLMATNYESNADFKDKFKGLRVMCEKNGIPASVVAFNLTHSYSNLRVYYHNSDDTIQMKYDFTVTSSDVRYNHYTHDYSNSEITFNDTVDNSKLYVQGASGTRVWISFPNLQEWANSLNNNVAINDAKLILSGAIDMADTVYYKTPSKLVAAGAKFDTDTTYVLLPDQLISSDYFGGYYDKNTQNVWFRITEYVQNVIKNGSYATKCNGLLIYVDQGSSTPHRWDFHGPQSDSLDKRVRLEIVYSLIND